MKKLIIASSVVFALVFGSQAQNVSKGKVVKDEKGKGFYYESILKDINAVEEKTE